MNMLTITVYDATEAIRQRAVEALSAAGIAVDRALLEEGPSDEVPPPAETPAPDAAADTDPHPHGWPLWVANILFAGVFAMLVAWIWLGDWRAGATAGLAFVIACVFFLGSF